MGTKITIDNMRIENFKGIRALDVEFGPDQTDIYGDNATGKTTVADAYTWALFGKDSENMTAFGIKPVDRSGDVAEHSAVTSVALTLTVNDRTYELKREYAEKWTKKRGSTNPVFSGNETTYYIDGVPKKKTEYERFIKGMLDEDTFRMLTNPAHFASVMDWKTRREKLMSLAGEITDADVLNANPTELGALAPELDKYSHADLMKKLKADRTRVNKKRTEIPVRIDEAFKSLANIDSNEEDAAAQLDSVRADIERAQKEIADVRAGGNAAEISELTAKIGRLRDQQAAQARETMAAYNAALNNYDMQRRGYESSIRNLETAIQEQRAAEASVIQKRDEMRRAYLDAQAETWNDDGICPTCGQPLPEDQIEEKRAAFNVRKSKRLEKMSAEGAELNVQLATLDGEWEAMERQLETERERLAALIQPIAPDVSYKDSPEIEELVARRNEIESGSENAQKETLARLQNQLAALREEEAGYVQQIGMIESDKATRARIEKLQDEERKLSAEIGRIDAMIDACEQFTRTKVDLVESKINGMFKIARWRLFKTQINGGLEECCDLTVNGVPWADLNSAMRINAGIDVINTLSSVYGASAPVFIDNAESVSQLAPLNGQMIRLIVSEDDKELRIEEVA